MSSVGLDCDATQEVILVYRHADNVKVSAARKENKQLILEATNSIVVKKKSHQKWMLKQGSTKI